MAVDMYVELRSRNDNDQAPWLVVARDKNDRAYVLMYQNNPAQFDDREEAEAQLDRIRSGEPDPVPGGCFLTTACEVALEDEFLDDGIELSTLRLHRDRLAEERPALRDDVEDYYAHAPQIVQKINENDDAAGIYQWIFDNMVVPTNEALAQGDDETAISVYKQGDESLKARFLD